MELPIGDIWAWVGGGLTLVIAGVVGNAAWAVVKPATRWLVRNLYGLLTLFMQKGRDDIFRLAARRSRRIGAQLGTIAVAIVILTLSLSIALRFANTLLQHPEASLRVDEVTSAPTAIPLVVIPLFLLPIVVFMVLRFLLLLGQATIFADGFEQRLAVLGPYLTREDTLLLESKFALMRTENDYREISAEMLKLAMDNNITLPSD